MKRTQLYFEEDLWTALSVRARSDRTTVSDLVRRAARDRYLGKLDERREAMHAFVGIREDRSGDPGAVKQVRHLRKGSRLDRLGRE